MKNTKEKLNNLIDNLNEWSNYISSQNEELKGFYNNNYFDRCMYCNGEEKKLTRDDFDLLLENNIEYISSQVEFINSLINLDIVNNNRISRQMEDLLTNCINSMSNELMEQCNESLVFNLQYKTNFSLEYNSILILSRFSEIDSNVVLIGGNGSGKSMLAKSVKGNDTENIVVIPAQKTLYFSLHDSTILSARVKELERLLLENNISKSKEKDDYGYFEFQNNQFTKLIIAMREQYFNKLISYEKARIPADLNCSIFGKLRDIFQVVFPDIKLSFEYENIGYLCCEKDNNLYHVNALSEGEKAVIYYTISVLMAKENSFIVIDEPETYLNPSLVNLLWDLLVEKRKDCQFIFITHSVDFVMGRTESKIAWIKRYEFPYKWEFDFVDDRFNLPKPMLTEVLGSQKKILFCEGDDKTSLDYRVYRGLFGKEYTVLPVGGHLDVIKSCEVISSSPWIGKECIGIIDGDNHTKDENMKLEEIGVYLAPINEIEMLLVSEEVMRHTIGSIYPEDAEDRIENFKKSFWERVSKARERIALTFTKVYVDDYLSCKKIDSCKNIDSICGNLKAIADYDAKCIFDAKLNEINSIITEEDYESLLSICNLKNEISSGLANKNLDNNYDQKAIQQIVSNESLKAELKKKYFGRIDCVR